MLEQVTRHIERRIGAIHTVFHEVVSDDLHIDLHHVKSTLFRRCEILVTSGMSARPMQVPSGARVPRFAEVLMVLPKGWPLSKSDFDDEKCYWPMRLMKSLARYPHHHNTWLGFGHTLANGATEAQTQPYAEGTSLCASVLLPPSSLREAAWSFKRSDKEDVFLWAAVPLHLNE
ncbi:MAG TPA: suppressor of fused domain protein, partial [Albitalea sp.]|nr:suppressor of fused domain protein [Albitalea sp.]